MPEYVYGDFGPHEVPKKRIRIVADNGNNDNHPYDSKNVHFWGGYEDKPIDLRREHWDWLPVNTEDHPDAQEEFVNKALIWGVIVALAFFGWFLLPLIQRAME